VESAAARLRDYDADVRTGVLLTGDIDTMQRLADAVGGLRRVNLGGLHHRAGRRQRLRYVFLAPEEEASLRALAARGTEITAQDVPAAAPVSLDDVLQSKGDVL